MTRTWNIPVIETCSLGVAAVLALLTMSAQVSAGQSTGNAPTFTKEIAPILQRHCQSCHHPNALAPMSLMTYEEVRPWARSIKNRTRLRDRMGVMPPWFIEKDVGIQQFKEDMSLSEEEITTIARWADAGAPRGNPADMPAPLVFAGPGEWEIGEPDLVVKTASRAIAADAPDWWGVLPPVSTGLTEDRYVAKMQVKEVNNVARTVGGQFVFHHANYTVLNENSVPAGVGGWPTIHDLRNNPSGFTFDEQAGRLLPARSQLQYDIVHMHANGRDTTAHLEVAFVFHPPGYQPTKRIGGITFGTRELDVLPMESDQRLHFYRTLDQNVKLTQFGPHMHAAGVRMCLELIWGGRVETLNCAGYDHNWLQYYRYADEAAPLLPKGAILHGIGYFDSTPTNPNVADPRNWSGLGHRAIDNMLLLIAPAFILTDEEFQLEIAARRERLALAEGETVLGCPLCGVSDSPAEGQQ